MRKLLAVLVLFAASPGCGPDGQGGVCGSGWCGEGETCNLSGRCVPFAPKTWAVILAGALVMGSPADEPGREPGEVQHEVTLTHHFAMLSTEVTIGEFVDLMGYDPVDYLQFYLCDRECPVSTVNWHEAAAYCNALSAAEGYPECYTCNDSPYYPFVPTCEPSTNYATPYDCPGFRLPTEAEWEYAARAGTTTSTYNGTFDEDHLCCERPNPALDPVAWFCGEDDLTMHPVGQKQPNSWGLYDMLGNQWEWCHDFHADYPPGPATDPWGPPSGTPRVQRGGCFHMCAFFARSAYHGASHPDNRDENSGFRPVRTLP
ncbi:MAG TPA: formylglycine-generating enzyme family protein [Myxococcota bacterium]|nr:formylglycine-generating enzyme family protein [Myxococcota bacterium]